VNRPLGHTNAPATDSCRDESVCVPMIVNASNRPSPIGWGQPGLRPLSGRGPAPTNSEGISEPQTRPPTEQ